MTKRRTSPTLSLILLVLSLSDLRQCVDQRTSNSIENEQTEAIRSLASEVRHTSAVLDDSIRWSGRQRDVHVLGSVRVSGGETPVRVSGVEAPVCRCSREP